MSLKVIVQPSAEKDIQSLYDYIFQRSVAGAYRWANALDETLASLEHRATYCGLAAESRFYQEPIREVLFRTRMGNAYRALFVIRGDVVHVLHVRGPGQDHMTPTEFQPPDSTSP